MISNGSYLLVTDISAQIFDQFQCQLISLSSRLLDTFDFVVCRQEQRVSGFSKRARIGKAGVLQYLDFVGLNMNQYRIDAVQAGAGHQTDVVWLFRRHSLTKQCLSSRGPYRAD